MHYDLIAHAGIALALAVQFVRGPKHLLWMAAFLVPMDGLLLRLGVQFTWAKLVTFFLFAALIVYGRNNPLRRLPGGGMLVLLLTYVVLLTLGVSALDPEAALWIARGRTLGWGVGQAELRHVVQIGSTLLAFALLLGGYLLVTDEGRFEATLRGLVTGAAVSVTIGIYQAVAVGMRLPWIDPSSPMARRLAGSLSSRPNLGAIYSVGPLRIGRLWGLGGEPKRTAALLVTITLLILLQAMSGDRTKPLPPWTAALFVLGIALTFSTSGYVALVAMILLVLALARTGDNVQERQRATNTMAVFLAVSMMLGGLNFALEPEKRSQIIQERLTDRLGGGTETVGQYQPGDNALLLYMTEKPYRSVLGLGLGGSGLFTIEQTPSLYHHAGPQKPGLFVVRCVGDIGIVGMGLAILLWLTWVATMRHGEDTYGRMFVLIGGLTMLVQLGEVMSGYLLMTGAFFGRSVSRQLAESRESQAVDVPP